MSDIARDFLSKSAKKASKGMKILLHEDQLKYSKSQFVQIYKGYDFLENLFVVRTYIQRHYEIDLSLLELLLKLMGMKVFTRAEYSELPKRFTYSRFNTFLDSGYVNILSDHRKIDKRLFCLNTKGKNIVINFYKYLSGEKKIPEDGGHNPMSHRTTQYAFDRRKLELIKRMNKLSIKNHNKKLF